MPAGPSPLDWLRQMSAQTDVLDGLSRYPDWPTLWTECPRGDWLLGIADRLGVAHVTLVRAAIACARIVADDGEGARVLEIAERWSNGQASEEDVAAATRDLERAATRAVSPASEAASRAALAVGLGVSDRGVLTAAPAAAVESTMMSSIDCGFEIAIRWAHGKCAAAVRTAVPWSVVAPCVERLQQPD
jgi:hypothetical protein